LVAIGFVVRSVVESVSGLFVKLSAEPFAVKLSVDRELNLAGRGSAENPTAECNCSIPVRSAVECVVREL